MNVCQEGLYLYNAFACTRKFTVLPVEVIIYSTCKVGRKQLRKCFKIPFLFQYQILHGLLIRRPVRMRLADTVIRIFSVPTTWALSYTVTCMKDNDITARPSESDSSFSMVLKFSSRQQNFNNHILQLWEDWKINLMCLDTCPAIANVIFLLRTHQLPWA